jgi:uncharacterized Zn-binding protein involved in type VI secretion
MKQLAKSDRDKAREVIRAIRKSAASQPTSLIFRLAMPFRCSVRYADYLVFFEREHANCKYRSVDVLKEGDDKPTAQGELRRVAQVTNVNAEDIDWARVSCPYCSSAMVVQCGCGKLYCGGAVVGQMGSCPWCGNSLPIGTGTISEVAWASLESRRPSIPAAGRKSLPGQTAKYLTTR